MEKSYAGKGRVTREFQVGEHVFLKVKPKKSSLKLGNYTKVETNIVDHLRYWA
jgi:hypothetical protein